MHTLISGYAKGLLTMFVKRKKNRSGTTSVVVVEKTKGIYKELITIGVAKDSNEIDSLVNAGHEWISKEESRRHPQLDLYGEEREACDREREEVRRVLSNVSNILLNGCDLILDRTFDRIGFNRIDDEVFRKLVKARLAYPTSKAATVEYLKNHFDEDVDLSKIYRYLDKLSDHQHEIVQDISVRHTAKLFGGNIGVLFYDVNTLYFEADYEDELRKTGFSKEGCHSNPQKAERYAKLNNINLSHLIEKFLMKLQTPSAKDNAALTLPDHLKKLAGCLSDVSDDNDEKLSYLLEKYK